jgi:hypothetical protein
MSEEEITSEHTCARIGQILDEIDALRLEMGRAKDARVPMHVREASPREVFYHAQTVHRKADRLCVELGGGPVRPPDAGEPARARPADVLRVLDSARARLAEARARLRVEGDAAPPELPGPLPRIAGKQASDVLAGCLLASRQLNVMLGHAFGSDEAHELLVRALGLTERLLAAHGAALPPAPRFERRKFPRDVFQLLWQASEVLRQILSDSGVAALEIERGFVGEQPTDVYDLASLLVSELEYLASFLPPKEAQRSAAASPSPVLPAHNFQRAGQLRDALGALAESVRARRSWLGVDPR